MQIDWTFDDENTYGVVYAMVELDAHETDELVQRAYERFGRLIKADPGTERERAAELLTDRELERFVAESVMAVAADDAMARLDRNVMFVPQCERREPLREHEPFAFAVKTCTVPDMNLDLDTPIQVPEGEDAARRVVNALRNRLNGTVPDAHLKRQRAIVDNDFRQELRDADMSERDYRIEHRLKPDALEARLRQRAMDELTKNIALELVFLRKGLEAGTQEEDAMLSAFAPGNEEALRQDMADSGRLCLLYEEARRHAALDWAVENLTDQPSSNR
ncbi:trigger factor [Slackia heliotrinireducens]|uniref:Trigger factor C-terminal domain-containing protein n=1 Tax=Slackia heliotrinireducens (strain ATCC 29202 / DSM 20476 / NCTC 11029 / RHS 1) TaxID=471855 RepID=C7N848_SLAHD|nr:hypothetical protein [Slackia heliotrinireducens]ACV23083.1 hypothetical protein Shel_20720 [Slackia heliotrinireducens DSM 20476]VEH02059.1 trigger factor [Slackia heliotrinireducens]